MAGDQQGGGNGLTNKEALATLHKDILDTVARSGLPSSCLGWLAEAWLPGSPLSLFRLTSLVFCLLLALALIPSRSGLWSDRLSSGLILTLVGLNLILSAWESYQRRLEVTKRVRRMAAVIGETLASCEDWGPEHFPHLHTPQSTSIVLQWTVRDGQTVNLPWALLVRGDMILVRQGQVVPGRCRLVTQDLLLNQGETYHADKTGLKKNMAPEFRDSLSPQRFLLEETPYLTELERVLASKARPLSMLTKRRHFLISSLLEHISFPTVLVLVVAWNCVRHSYSWSWISDQPLSQLFFMEPVSATLPLLPLVLPLWWVAVNTAGLANVLALFRQPAILVNMGASSDPFDDTVESPGMEETAPQVSWLETWPTFLSCLLGTGEHLVRTENLLHSLGSVTSLCCSDKKGLLSWPNTSPEKIFFFKQGAGRDQTVVDSDSTDKVVDKGEFRKTDSLGVTSEILTVTHDHNNPFKVEFDDPVWSRHLSSLKPLGLSVLLNTCNMNTEQKYTDFYNYLVCESSEPNLARGDPLLPDLLPIPARGCLCELSRHIGLEADTRGGWQLEQQLQTFRPVVADTTDTSSFTKNLSLAKLKFPFPHMVSLVAREREVGRLQLLTQGTADIVLDSCQDTWTGRDLVPLTEELRKKCLEFYHRASLTSYCSAFSYRPLTVRPPWPASTSELTQYLEIPNNSFNFLSSGLEDSIDRVSLCDTQGSVAEDCGGQPSACLESQRNQSFLGMVQMQYQARVDMVQFIDLLEKACIRFVHFSKENELRSRVFSEKMGLECGWNCHISLASGTIDLAAAPSLMYGRRPAVRKSMSSKTAKAYRQMSCSLPGKLGKQGHLLDFPQWVDTSKPLISNGGQFGSEESGVGSSSSMLQYDMSNRAKLPAGIENIRPHLDKMDNVPLLVSLFTDCTPSSTRQMVEIMQENGEVVVMLGSSASHHNMRVFLTADASLAVEPLYPQVCQQVPVFTKSKPGLLAPTDLARHLTSVASSVSFKREEDLSLYHAIIASRRHVLAILHGLQLWVSSCLFLSLVVLLPLLLLLPTPLTPPQLLVVTSLYLPVLATAAFFSAHDNNIRNISTGKNTEVSLNRTSLCHTAWCYGLRFCPALLSTTLSHLLSVANLVDQCSTLDKEISDQSCYSLLAPQLDLLTDTNMTFVTVFIVLASNTYVSRTDHLWQYRPSRSCHILLASFLVLVVQLAYQMGQQLGKQEVAIQLPIWAWVINVGFLPVIIIINELIKRQEIKVNVRFQKRAKLDFGTKLGINSPF